MKEINIELVKLYLNRLCIFKDSLTILDIPRIEELCYLIRKEIEKTLKD